MRGNKKITKRWIRQTILITLIIVTFIVGINYINDPLWVFNKENFTNKTRIGFNERQQKTNLIYFGSHDYDSIMLGNSKATYMNALNFKPGKLFNYGISAMNPVEYEDYLNFFKQTLGKEPKYIVLAIDFNVCMAGNGKILAGGKKQSKINQHANPQNYISETLSPSYKFKHLLSYDTFAYSLRNLTRSLDEKKAIYNQQNVKVKVGFDQMAHLNLPATLAKVKKNPRETFENAIYNQNLTNILRKIKKDNPKSEFVIIFTPDYMPVFTINNNKPIYDKCLNDLTEIFGKENIFNFMELNEMTVDSNNYYDGSHFRPEIGDFIFDEISQEIKLRKL